MLLILLLSGGDVQDLSKLKVDEAEATEAVIIRDITRFGVIVSDPVVVLEFFEERIRLFLRDVVFYRATAIGRDDIVFLCVAF